MFTFVYYKRYKSYPAVAFGNPLSCSVLADFSVVCHDQRSHGFLSSRSNYRDSKKTDYGKFDALIVVKNAQFNPFFSQSRKENRRSPFGRSCQSFLHLQNFAANTTILPTFRKVFLFQKHLFATERPLVDIVSEPSLNPCFDQLGGPQTTTPCTIRFLFCN